MVRDLEKPASPAPRLLAGLLVTLAAVIIYSAYTASQIRLVRQLQQDLVERNRRDSLQLIRIQDNLNSLGLAMRDMLDATEPYPLSAWSAQLGRVRRDLDDAIRSESQLAPARSRDQAVLLQQSLGQFWAAFDNALEQAKGGDEKAARALIRDSLQSRQAALTSGVARLLVHNNEAEQEAAKQITSVYDGVERNIYLLLAAIVTTIALTGVLMIYSNRRLFLRITDLSAHRSELARRLITTQEETLRSVSRELHDEFGQVLTAIGVMLQRAERRHATELVGELGEAREAAQEALDKVRSLSQSLQPVMLEEAGLPATLDWYLPLVERQTGLKIRYEKPAGIWDFSNQAAISMYRIVQEALNNVVRHSGSKEAFVRLRLRDAEVTLEVEDSGRGIAATDSPAGIGMVGMRERAALLGGHLEIRRGPAGGTIVRLTIPDCGMLRGVADAG